MGWHRYYFERGKEASFYTGPTVSDAGSAFNRCPGAEIVSAKPFTPHMYIKTLCKTEHVFVLGKSLDFIQCFLKRLNMSYSSETKTCIHFIK